MFDVPVRGHYLKTQEVDRKWLRSCRHAMRANPAVRDAVKTLRDITARIADNEGCIGTERDMREPLVSKLILATIREPL